MSSKMELSSFLHTMKDPSESPEAQDPLNKKKQDEVSQLMSLSPDSLIFPKDLHFSPEQHLISTWTGDSLLSAEALLIRHHLNELWSMSLEQFDKIRYRNMAMKKAVYQEFYPYLSRTQHHNFKDANKLWEILGDTEHPLHEEVQTFKAIFTFRSVVVYFFKIRFMAHFAKQAGHELTADEVLNPSTYVRQHFPNGSKYYFTSLALETNPYTWLTPSNSYATQLLELIPLFLKIKLTELTKIITFTQTKYINLSEVNNSHALSHQAFGYFVNTLLIHIPRWLDSSLASNSTNHNFPRALKTLFVGDFLKSLILSHSLDQELHVVNRWQEVITANIEDNSFASAHFFQICHELQILTLLTKVAARQGHHQTALIANVMNEKYSRGEHFNQQEFLFELATSESPLLYQRLILNLTSLPGTNPYPNLLKRINQEMNLLQDGGLLYVFTNQKIFVQSQVERFKTLLSKMRLEFICDFSSLKGKGEVTKYLYVFSKRKERKDKKQLMQTKENCPTFIFKGRLHHFGEFKNISDHFHKFIQLHPLEGTTIISQQITNNLSFSFYQDAIIDGHILSAVQKEQSSIVHPTFFEKITKNTIPLRDLFQVELITEHSKSFTENILGFTIDVAKTYPFVLVVDFCDRQIIKLEIIQQTALEAYQEQYGTVGHFYLKLLPLHHSICIETLRTFFTDKIGVQLVQMTINEKSLTSNKITSSIKNLLIPKFFIEISIQEDNPIPLLDEQYNTLLSYTPQQLKALYNDAEALILTQLEATPVSTLEKIIKFRNVLQQIKMEIKQTTPNFNMQVFNNPLIKKELMKSNFKKIFPHHEDIHIEFLETKNTDHLITNVSLITDQDPPFLVLHDNKHQVELARIYSDIKLLTLIKFFITNSKQNISFKVFISNLKIPTLDSLNKALQTIEQTTKQINFVMLDIEQLISSTFFTQLTKDANIQK